MVYYAFQVSDGAGFNGSIYIRATTDPLNIFYRPSGEEVKLLFTKNLGSASGHCAAIQYIFDKWFPQFRSQQPPCLSNPQNINIEIGTKQGYGIYAGSKLIMPNGEQYSYQFSSTTVHALAYSYNKKPPIQQFVRLNDFSNSKLTYNGRRTPVRDSGSRPSGLT